MAIRPLITFETEHELAIITIERPHVRNAVNRECAEALSSAVDAFEADDRLKVAVLAGRGGHFCSGADLKAIALGKPNRLDVDGDGPMGPSRRYTSKPVIAALSGYAVAGGLELALWCDLRVMESDSILGVFCRRWGVPLIDGGTVRLPRLICMGRALDLILTGRPVDATEALSIGLVNRVVPSGHALAAAKQLALEISQFPQECVRADRTSAYEQWDLSLEAALRNEFMGAHLALQTESSDGARRFLRGNGRHGPFKD